MSGMHSETTLETLETLAKVGDSIVGRWTMAAGKRKSKMSAEQEEK